LSGESKRVLSNENDANDEDFDSDDDGNWWRWL